MLLHVPRQINKLQGATVRQKGIFLVLVHLNCINWHWFPYRSHLISPRLPPPTHPIHHLCPDRPTNGRVPGFLLNYKHLYWSEQILVPLFPVHSPKGTILPGQGSLYFHQKWPLQLKPGCHHSMKQLGALFIPQDGVFVNQTLIPPILSINFVLQ